MLLTWRFPRAGKTRFSKRFLYVRWVVGLWLRLFILSQRSVRSRKVAEEVARSRPASASAIMALSTFWASRLVPFTFLLSRLSSPVTGSRPIAYLTCQTPGYFSRMLPLIGFSTYHQSGADGPKKGLSAVRESAGL